MSGIATAVAVTAGAGAYMQKRAGDHAANAANLATQVNADTERSMYNQSRTDLEPWRTAGGKANTTLMDLMGYKRP